MYPGQTFLKWWNFFRNLLILYFCIMVPYRIGFNSGMFTNDPIKEREELPHEKGWSKPIWHELAFDVLLFIDIIFNFRTAFIKDILTVDDWKYIALHYTWRHFIFDLIATPPFYINIPELMFLKLPGSSDSMHVSKLTLHPHSASS